MIPRVPLSPTEFDARVREIADRVRGLSQTSGGRNEERNRQVGGSPESKHLTKYAGGMAVDFAGSTAEMAAGAELAHELGLWFVIHDKGSGNHLHLQGLPPGQVAEWWQRRYMDPADWDIGPELTRA